MAVDSYWCFDILGGNVHEYVPVQSVAVARDVAAAMKHRLEDAADSSQIFPV